MERASKLIRGLRLPGDTITAEELACAAWPEAVGKKIAAHTRRAKLVRTRLVVEVEDRVWQRQLFALTGQISATWKEHLGRGLVEDLEFRIVPRRREPQRANEAAAGALPRRSRRHRRPRAARPLQAPGKRHWRENHRKGSPLRGRTWPI